MIPGLVNSVVNADLHATRPVLQMALIPGGDDPRRQIADLEQRLRDSEAAYDTVVEALSDRDAEARKLRGEVAHWRGLCEATMHVAVYGQRGIVRGRR